MTRSEESRLVEKAVDADFFGAEGLSLDEALPVPEQYSLIRRIGQGGGGTVYLAHDLSLDRMVALKYLADARRADLERFRREARLTARLNSPHIVQVYEMAEVEGRPYIAMQFVDGANLAEADLATPELIRTLRDVVMALRHAHQQGIVHRDIKPENVLLDRKGGSFLTDFGIARDLTRGGMTLSQEGQVMGTPALMPPEQARGEPHAVDARSDIYSFGATLYHKLTGRRPFDGTNIVDVLHDVIHTEPPFMRSLDPSIPRSLEAIVLKCMQKHKTDRYQDMSEVLAEIDLYLAGQPVHSESGAWFKRLVGKLVGVPESLPDAEPAPDEDLTTRIEVVREIAAWDTNLYRTSGSMTRAFGQLDDIVRRLTDLLVVRPDLAWARFYRGVAHFRRGRLTTALDDMERSIDRISDLASAYFELGRLYLATYLKGQHTQRKHVSESGVTNGLRAIRSAVDQAVIAFNEAHRLRGELPFWQVSYARAVTRLAEFDYSGCIAHCDEILESDPDAEEVWKLRGDAVRFDGGDPTESYDRALDIRRCYFEAVQAKAEWLEASGEIERVRECTKEALRIHPEYTDALALEARTYLHEARNGASENALERGLEAVERAAAIDAMHYDLTLTRFEILFEMALRDDETGRLDEALDCLERAAGLEGCQNRVQILAARARIERARRKPHAEARTDLERIIAKCEQHLEQEPASNTWIRVLEQARAALP